MHALIRTARMTGLLYLGLAITGALGFLLIRPQLFAADDPSATLANLVEHESLARASVACELLIVLTQALTAAWFYRLLRTADPLAAGGIAAFGLVNAVTILINAALLATAVELALDPVGDAAATVQLLYLVSGNLWALARCSSACGSSPWAGACSARAGCPAPSTGSSSAAASDTCSAPSLDTSSPTHRFSLTPSPIPRPWASSG